MTSPVQSRCRCLQCAIRHVQPHDVLSQEDPVKVGALMLVNLFVLSIILQPAYVIEVSSNGTVHLSHRV